MIVVLMGVTGSGKTTVGRVLARELGWTFVDADDYHPAAMSRRCAGASRSTDEDRRPWLQVLAGRIDEARDRGENLVLACSALKHAYQEYLRHHLDVIRCVCLCGPEDLIKARLAARTGHFMNPALLEGQFEILDPPDDAIRVDVSRSPEEIAGEIRSRLASTQRDTGGEFVSLSGTPVCPPSRPILPRLWLTDRCREFANSIRCYSPPCYSAWSRR